MSSTRENSGGNTFHGAAGLEFGHMGLELLPNLDSPEPERPVDMKPSVCSRSAVLHCNPPPLGCPFGSDVSLLQDMNGGPLGKFTSSPAGAGEAGAGRATSDECYSERGNCICEGPGLPMQEGDSLMDAVYMWSDHGFGFFKSSILVAVLAFLACVFQHRPSRTISPNLQLDEPASPGADRLASDEVAPASSSHAERKVDADLLNSLIFSLIESPSITEDQESFMTLGPINRAELVRGEIYEVKTTANRIEALVKTGLSKMAAPAYSWIARPATPPIVALQQWASRTDALLCFVLCFVFALAVQSRVSRLASRIDLNQHATKGPVQTSDLFAEVEAELD